MATLKSLLSNTAISRAPTTLTAVLLACILIYLTRKLYSLYSRAYRRQPYASIPYHASAPTRPSGDLPLLNADMERLHDPSKVTIEQFRKLAAPLIQLFVIPLHRPVIAVLDTREVHDVLSHRTRELNKIPATCAPLKYILPGASIAKSDPAEFNAHLRLWNGVIGVGFLRYNAAHKMYKTVGRLMTLFRLKAELGSGRPFAVIGDFNLALFDVLWESLFGYDLQGLEAEAQAVRNGKQPEYIDENGAAHFASAPFNETYNLSEYMRHFCASMMASPFPGLYHAVHRLAPGFRQCMRHRLEIESRVLSLAAARRDTYGDALYDEKQAAKTGYCALDHALLRQKKRNKADDNMPHASTQAIIDELLSLLVGGVETVGGTMTWGSKYLSNSPVQQAKLRAALRKAFPGGQPSVEAILDTEIPYLDATVEEFVRLGAAIPEVARMATVDTTILGTAIPKGAMVLFCNSLVEKPQFAVDERLRSAKAREKKDSVAAWHDGVCSLDEFHPERWLRPDGSFDGRAFPRLAFSYGPRACFGTFVCCSFPGFLSVIRFADVSLCLGSGKNFALQQIRVAVALLVLNFEFQPMAEQLNKFDAAERRTHLFRCPMQSYVRLAPL